MNKKETTLWAVYTNDDLTEGRGRQYVKHFCSLEATALRLANRNYVQGSDCPVKPVTVLVLDGEHVLPTSLLRIEEPTAEDARRQTVSDLREITIEKAKALGLTDKEIGLISGGSNV